MRKLLALFALTSVAWATSDTPKNLLRYNVGALPMLQNPAGQWVTTAAQNLDWKSPQAALLAGDVGQSVDVSQTKVFVVDLGSVESVNRFSLYSASATGSVKVASSPVFEDPATGQWSELGSLELKPGQASSLTTTAADARYLRFVFSPESQGRVGSMGAFGSLTYAGLTAADTMQTPNTPQSFALNYASPATQMSISSSDPEMPEADMMALFDDDPATQLVVDKPMTLIVDMGSSRQIASLIALGNASNMTVQLAQSPEGLPTAASSVMESGAATTLPSAPQAQFARIRLLPSGNTPTSINTFSLVGPVDPQALVLQRNATSDDVGDVAAPAASGGGALAPVTPITPRVTSE